MPRTPEQNQQLRSERSRQLLGAALRTFARLGFERATVRDIAQEAGVAQGLLYSYFRSKDDILREVFEQGAHDVADALAADARALATPATAPDTAAAAAVALEHVIRRSVEIVRERREFWQLNYMVRHQPQTALVLGDAPTTWAEGVRQRLEALLRAIGHDDAPVLARVLFGAIDGVAQHYTLQPDTYPLDATAECLVRQFCRRPSGTAAQAQRPLGRRAGQAHATATRRGAR